MAQESALIQRDGSIVNTLLVVRILLYFTFLFFLYIYVSYIFINFCQALLEPNTGHLLLPFINYTLAALLVVLAGTAFYWPSIHLAVLAFFAVGLLASINWFIYFILFIFSSFFLFILSTCVGLFRNWVVSLMNRKMRRTNRIKAQE